MESERSYCNLVELMMMKKKNGATRMRTQNLLGVLE